jgi:glycosyltransferase involved in cell wall biosynthesis
VRVLVVTNLYPGPGAPQRGRFVHDQVAALQALPGVDLELFRFEPGARNYAPATRSLRRHLRRQRYDVVHAHYGLTGWCCAAAGARPLAVTFHGTDVRHRAVGPLSRQLQRRIDLTAAVSSRLFGPESGRPGLARRRQVAVLPCGVDLDRFQPASRPEARRRLGLDEAGRYLLFPADPGRPGKRHDRATEVARLAGAELLTAGSVDPESMPDWVNAANAVLVPSDNEGFGLATLEALACDVPVLSTPVGIAPHVLRGAVGCLVAPFDPEQWAAAAAAALDDSENRIEGRYRAARFSATLMAERAAVAYRELAALAPYREPIL